MSPAADVLICLDKFRGSMTAPNACSALARGMRGAAPDCAIRVCPVADGGEGTIDALIAAGYRRQSVHVTGPDGQAVEAALAVRGGRAVVELAQAAGLHLARKGAIAASTYGVGELMSLALDAGCREIVLALGGSATSDGGAGMLSALGVRLYDASGRELRSGAGELIRLSRVDLSGLDARLRTTALTLACDVSNPLLGVNGAAAVFGPQKGADASDIDRLEAGLAHFAGIIEEAIGVHLSDMPGAGAAGGAGFAGLALGGRIRSGVEFVLDETGVSSAISTSRLIIVGEGSIDSQTLQGKAPIGIASLAVQQNVPVVAVAGRVLLDSTELESVGISASYAIVDVAPNVAESMSGAAQFLQIIGERIALRYLALDRCSSEDTDGDGPELPPLNELRHPTPGTDEAGPSVRP